MHDVECGEILGLHPSARCALGGRGRPVNKRVVNSPKIARTYRETSAHATKANGDLVFVTGQVANKPGSDPRTTTDPEMGTLEEQTVRVLENIRAILEQAGTSFEHVVKRNVYLTHPGDFDTVYAIMERYVTSPVASTGIVAGLVPVGARVEIDVIAVAPS
jgi:2-iminobutanoate/2-iminopropanoate deaminase